MGEERDGQGSHADTSAYESNCRARTLRGQQLHDVRVEADEQLMGVRGQPGLPPEQLHDAGQRAAGDADGAAPGLRIRACRAICCCETPASSSYQECFIDSLYASHNDSYILRR